MPRRVRDELLFAGQLELRPAGRCAAPPARRCPRRTSPACRRTRRRPARRTPAPGPAADRTGRHSASRVRNGTWVLVRTLSTAVVVEPGDRRRGSPARRAAPAGVREGALTVTALRPAPPSTSPNSPWISRDDVARGLGDAVLAASCRGCISGRARARSPLGVEHRRQHLVLDLEPAAAFLGGGPVSATTAATRWPTKRTTSSSRRVSSGPSVASRAARSRRARSGASSVGQHRDARRARPAPRSCRSR